MNRSPATPAPGLIDTGMPKLYALDLSDLPDANATDPADLASNCGCIGIDVERRDNLRALFRRNSIIAAACRDPGGKLDPRLFGDLPDAGGTDAANLSGNCGRIGIDVERRDDLSTFFFREFFPWHGRVTGLGLRNILRPHRRPMNVSKASHDVYTITATIRKTFWLTRPDIAALERHRGIRLLPEGTPADQDRRTALVLAMVIRALSPAGGLMLRRRRPRAPNNGVTNFADGRIIPTPRTVTHHPTFEFSMTQPILGLESA